MFFANCIACSLWGQMVDMTAITVVPVSLLSSYQYVSCVCSVSVCVVLCVVLWPCVFCVRSVRVRVCLV